MPRDLTEQEAWARLPDPATYDATFYQLVWQPPPGSEHLTLDDHRRTTFATRILIRKCVRYLTPENTIFAIYGWADPGKHPTDPYGLCIAPTKITGP